MPNKILCVHRGADDDSSMYWATADVQSDGRLVWSGDDRFMGGNAKSDEGPALAVFNNRIYCAFRDAVSDHLMISYWDNSARIWRSCGPITTAAICTPGLAAWDNKLFCVYQGDKGNEMYWASTSDPMAGQWSFEKFPWDNQMCNRAALTIYSNRLYCFHRGQPDVNPPTEKGQECFWTARDTGDWSNDSEFPVSMVSAAGPAGAVYAPGVGDGNELIIIKRGPLSFSSNDRNIYTTRFVRDDRSHYGLTEVGATFASTDMSNVSPSLAVCGDFLYSVYPSLDDSRLRWARWDRTTKGWAAAVDLGGHRSGREVGLLSVDGLMD